MMRWIRILPILCSVVCLNNTYAETVISALSAETVEISSNFTGTEIVIFGSIERDRRTISRAASYEIAITLKGPPVDVVTRQKERVAGIWINRNSRQFLNVPSFYSIQASGPLEDLATDRILQTQQLGTKNIVFPVVTNSSQNVQENINFVDAYRRLKAENGLFQEDFEDVEFLSETLFKSKFDLPALVPVGDYTIDVFLFRDGVLLAQNSQTLDVTKAGFERIVFDFSQNNSLLFGFATVCLAIFIGWLGGVVFRRE